MSVAVSILGLIKAGAEGLIPPDVMAHVAACEAATKDAAPLWIFADRLAELGEPELEDAFRYMAKRSYRPKSDSGSAGGWEWFGPREVVSSPDPFDLPAHLCRIFGDSYRNTRHCCQHRAPTWLGAVAYVGDELVRLRADLDVSLPPAIPAEETHEE